MSIRQIETGLMSPKQMDCAFLWLYCMDGVPYAKYLPEGAPFDMPMVLMLLRWDGRLGTMGGKVDPGEKLRDALSREVGEEADFWLPGNAEIEQLGTFQDGDWHIHAFAYEVCYAELLEARSKATKASERSPECAGWAIAPAGVYRPDDNGARGVEALRLNHFASTAGLEFDELVKQIHAKLAARNPALVEA
jgi:ADP-ribose pyrophosphatase YjhB (NUDIX family)